MVIASRLLRFVRSSFILFMMLSLFAVRVHAQGQAHIIPAGFTHTTLGISFQGPTTMRFAPDGRLFVLEQHGDIQIVQNDAFVAEFLRASDLSGVFAERERGLLGIAFPPNFASNPYVYLYYTRLSGGVYNNRISRFPVNGNDAGAEQVILDMDPIPEPNNVHNGGSMEFGPDGKLYVAVGETNRKENAQNLTTFLGKILRLNPDGSVPTDNPFYNQTTGMYRAIWARGLRNPYNFDIQNVSPYRMLINDVGQDTYEEINDGIAGANYGWPTVEGPFTPSQFPEFTNPLYAYSHLTGTVRGCAIIGAAFYNPPTQMFPASYTGDYFFMDYCDRWIRIYDLATDTVRDFGEELDYGAVALETAPSGALYYLTRGEGANGGRLHKITYATTGQPQITDQPDNITVAGGEQATFSCTASGNTPLTFKWQRNNDDIPGTTSNSATSPATRSYTIPAANFAADNGDQFRCIVSNNAGSATSNNALLTVQQGQRPTAQITLPVEGATFSADDDIVYSGTGTDPEDGTLGAANMEWRIQQYHNAPNNLHFHPVIESLVGVSGGTLTIPDSGHPEPEVWYRITLTVTDSDGLSHQVQRDIHPNTVAFNIVTEPPGLKISIDENPVQTMPYAGLSIINMQRELNAPTQIVNGKIYTFVSWSDGGAAKHTITTPSTDVTYTAIFVETPLAPNRETTSTPTLTWVRLPWALGYEIQIEDDGDFDTDDPIYYSKNDIPADVTSFSIPGSNALAEGTYYWRLRGLRSDGTWGAWSAVSSFIIHLP